MSLTTSGAFCHFSASVTVFIISLCKLYVAVFNSLLGSNIICFNFSISFLNLLCVLGIFVVTVWLLDLTWRVASDIA